MSLRPFNEHDWNAFAGCESEKPEIAYLELGASGDDEDTAVVVLDGKHVQLMFGCEDTYGADFANESLARLVAEVLVNPNLPTELTERATALGLKLL